MVGFLLNLEGKDSNCIGAIALGFKAFSAIYSTQLAVSRHYKIIRRAAYVLGQQPNPRLLCCQGWLEAREQIPQREKN